MEPAELIGLTADLDKTLQDIRAARNIQPPMMWCPNCQARHRSAPPRVSVRATILALGRFGVANAETVNALENSGRNIGRRISLMDRLVQGKQGGRSVFSCFARPDLSESACAVNNSHQPGKLGANAVCCLSLTCRWIVLGLSGVLVSSIRVRPTSRRTNRPL
jgi:hypothetical protein